MVIAEQSKMKKTERIVARTSVEQKALIEQAANLQGITVSDFIISNAYREAVKTIERHQVLKLSQRDSEIFAELLMNPPAPNEALKEAAQLHKTLVK